MTEIPVESIPKSGVVILDHEGNTERIGAGICELLHWVGPLTGRVGMGELFARVDGDGYSILKAAVTRVSGGEIDLMVGQLVVADSVRGIVSLAWTLHAMDGGARARSVALVLKNLADESADPASAESYRSAFDNAVEGIFRTSLDGRYIEANRALASIYGYESPAALMRELVDLNKQLYVRAGRRIEFVRLIQGQGFVSDFESEVYRADGSTVWIAEYARTVRGPGGEALFFEGSVVDITEHKQVEAALRDSRDRFRRLVESAHVVPWEEDLESGRMIYVGPQAEEFLGFPGTAWLEDGFVARQMHPDDGPWMLIARAESLGKRGNFQSEYRMFTADRRIVWVREIVSVSASEDGRELICGFMFDITHWRTAEESLKDSRHFIERVALASPVIWYVYDLESECVVYLNGGGIGLMGYTKEALLKLQPAFLVALAHPSEDDAWQEHAVRLATLAPGEIVEREFRMRAADGNWIWLRSYESTFKQDGEGYTTQVVGTAENITAHREAVEHLESNEALFRKLAETTPVIPFEVDLTARRFIYVGPQAEPLLGFPLGKWYGSDFWHTTIHPDDASAIDRLCREAAQFRGTDLDVEYRMRTIYGSYRWVRQIVHYGPDPEVSRIGRGYLIDVTAAKALEAEREHAKGLLKELAVQGQRLLEEERVRVAREIHDELGQSLTLFRIDLTWLGTRIGKLLNGATGAPLMDKLEAMETQLEATLQAARRITTALRPPVLDEFGLGEAIEWQANDFSRRVGIRCQVESNYRDNAGKATETAAFRIFQELLTNIARHSKASRVQVTLEQSQGSLLLSVQDNGCGFNPAATARKAGYGLLGVRERAEGIGGRVEIVSKPGEGTRVQVVLPSDPHPG